MKVVRVGSAICFKLGFKSAKAPVPTIAPVENPAVKDARLALH